MSNVQGGSINVPTGKWVLSLAALTENGIDLSKVKSAPVNDPRVDQFVLKDGDFLVSRSNTKDKVGRSGLYRGGLDQCSYPDLMMSFRINTNKVDPDYLEQYLRSEHVTSYFKKCACGTSESMVKINKKVLLSLLVPVPELSMQSKIAYILQTWDQFIEKSQKLINLKELYINNLTNNFISDQPVSKDYLIKDVCELSRGGNVTKDYIAKHPGNYPVYSSQTSNDGIIGFIDSYSFDGEYITWTTDGAHAGTVFYRCGKFSGTTHCGIAKVKNEEIIDAHYLCICLQKIAKRFVTQTGQPMLQAKDFGRIKIQLPKIEKQRLLSNLIKASKKEIILLKSLHTLIREQKRGLINKLLIDKWQLAQETTDE